MILPQLEQTAVYNAINFSLTMTYQDNVTPQTIRFNSYLAPRISPSSSYRSGTSPTSKRSTPSPRGTMSGCMRIGEGG